MNKNIKICLNYLIGASISIILLWSIWHQVSDQLSSVGNRNWLAEGDPFYLLFAIALMPLNLGTEALKWKLLAGSAQPTTYVESLKTVFAGIAFSLITPNRVGEYPGRILYLKKQNTLRLISVAILGAFAQFFTLFIYGLTGLIYFNYHYPGPWQKIVLIACIIITIIIGILFLSFERWIVYLEDNRWVRKFRLYGHILKRFSTREVCTILALSIFRFAVYTTQYLVLLYWMNIEVGLVHGFLMAALFFWAIAVIPSIALAEMGIRGKVSLFLFGHFTANALGILTVTVSLWCINLVIPAVCGSILLMRLKLFR